MAEVDVWVVAELGPAGRRAALAQGALSPDEIARADRYRDDAARDRFVVVRTALRTIVGGITGDGPARVPLDVEPTGRPVVAAGHGRAPLHLSVAHTDGCAVIAVCADGPVGVDAEPAERRVEPALGERVCTPGERALLAGCEGAAWTRTFLRLWVRKEAVVKADGRGLRVPLSSVDVSGEGPVHLTGGREPLHLRDLDVGPAHVAAVALVGAPPEVRSHPWSPSA